MKTQSFIADVERRLLEQFGLVPVIAAEIECYVAVEAENDDFWRPVDAILRDIGVGLIRIEKERGDHQYELVTQVTTPQRLIEWLNAIKSVISAQAQSAGVEATFAAKPFPDQPSSGLHLHLHLGDSEGINAYHKTEEWTSDALRWSLGGLLATLPAALPIFFPEKTSYERLMDIDHVPKIASWGVNNRYCALRIPTNEDPYDKRIEHRVPCADATPAHAVLALLEGVTLGLENKIEPAEQEFGKPLIGLIESLTKLPVELPLTSAAID
jgi:glutamine synthetase